MTLSSASIPKLIHQTWRDAEIPGKWREYQQSWRRDHSGWEYRLWTDLDLRRLILEHYPWFLPIYDNYPEPIQRVDAARYFLMHRYGGVYADLDLECLRPLDPLLRDRELVVGFEPEEHLAKPVVRSQGLEQLVGNAFMASRPGHPFWEHVFLELVGAHRLPGPLASTGPFFLTRALRSFASPSTVTCLPAATLYPGTSMEAAEGTLSDSDWRARIPEHAYAIHHWSGSWIDKGHAIPENLAPTLPFTLVDRGKQAMEGKRLLDPEWSGARPLVSCLMVTRSARIGCAKNAIACFQAQSYPSIELVVVDDGEGDELTRYLRELKDPRIIHVRPANGGRPLGALRNLAVSSSSGEYVAQWDDDDLYHPRRIEAQLSTIRATGADACLLSRWRIWWPRERRLAVSKRRGWEGSLLCLREKLPRYDETSSRGEDTPVVLRIASRRKLVLVDAPWLYTYVVHGGNTTPGSRLEDHWSQATENHWGAGYARAIRALAAELPEAVRPALLASATAGDAAPVADARGRSRPRESKPAAPADRLPRVLILTPVKDGLPFVASYLSGIRRLDYPADRLSLAWLESDSADGTFEALSSRLSELRQRLARVELHKRDYGFRPAANRADARDQLQRRSLLARSRNYLLSRSLRDEDWVLWLDFDVVDYPGDVIQRLLAHRRDIVVPHCVLAPGGRTFDLNTFVRSPAEQGEDFADDVPILQPPRGHGRRYLESLRDRELVEVDAVGGTMLLIRADLHREGLVFPVAPYKKHIETEGLSFLARDMGVSSWGVPGLEVIHANR